MGQAVRHVAGLARTRAGNDADRASDREGRCSLPVVESLQGLYHRAQVWRTVATASSGWTLTVTAAESSLEGGVQRGPAPPAHPRETAALESPVSLSPRPLPRPQVQPRSSRRTSGSRCSALSRQRQGAHSSTGPRRLRSLIEPIGAGLQNHPLCPGPVGGFAPQRQLSGDLSCSSRIFGAGASRSSARQLDMPLDKTQRSIAGSAGVGLAIGGPVTWPLVTLLATTHWPWPAVASRRLLCSSSAVP
jgi:hypothetical protein